MVDADTPDPKTPRVETTVAPQGVMPTKPIMGGLLQISKDEWGAWTGGKPKADWSQLEDAATTYDRPSQLRPMRIVDAQKSYDIRAKALPDEFKPNDDFQAFQLRLWKHFEKWGLDTVAYVPDPVTKKMLSVVVDHSRFTVATVKDQVKEQLKKYDSYDKENDKAATECLLATLGKDFRE